MAEALFSMPSLGADMERGTLTRWHIQPGQLVKRGQVVAEVETDKGLVDVECFVDGTVLELLAAEGFVATPGTPLARLDSSGPNVAAPPLSSTPTAPQRFASFSPSLSPESKAAAPVGGRVRASPLARKRAQEMGVDLSTLVPGPRGRINVADVEAAVGGATREDPVLAMRRAIAVSMSRSKREIPHYYLAHTVDVSAAMAWLRAANLARPVTERLLPGVLLLRAVARACREVPELNGHWVHDRPALSSLIHVCFATALRKGGGLVAPALFDVADKSLDVLMREMTDLIERVRGGKLKGRERTDGTITLTSLGDNGVEELFGVIQPPQLALVGIGKIVDRPWVVDGAVTIRSVARLTLAADHRASDGQSGSRFLRAVDKHLQQPETP